MEDGNNKQSKKSFYRYFTDTAIIGLMVTIIVSTFQIFQASQQTKQLSQQTDQLSESLVRLEYVEKSVTTHFLGAFPEYIIEINDVLQSFETNVSDFENDTIIIFEDVLYYGIRSSPNEFVKMNRLLLELADRGCHIVIAYYNPSEWNRTFKLMVRDELISPVFFSQMNDSIFAEVKKTKDFLKTENKNLQIYFDKTRRNSDVSVENYRKKVDSYRQYIYNEGMPNSTPLDKEMISFCKELDSIKSHYMGDSQKDIYLITFNDFVEMYRAFDAQIKQHYMRNERSNFIELIEMNEYLTMSCWLVRDKTVLAFPSKYATEEIGFISQDKAFVDYIHTMLVGVRSQLGRHSVK